MGDNAGGRAGGGDELKDVDLYQDEEELPMGEGESDTMKATPTVSCCSRMRSELRGPLFSLDERNGAVLDVEASFAPRPVWRTAVVRLVLLGLTVGGMAESIVSYPVHNRWIWMGYLTHWTLILSTAYFLSAIICTLFRGLLAQPEKQGGGAGAFVRWTWGLFGLVAPLNVAVVLLFWTLDYQAGDTIYFRTIMLHGVTAALILFDGNVIGMIPLRLKQIVFAELLGAIFIVWSIVHSYSGLGDGDWEGEANDPNDTINDDVLYDVLNWEDSPGKAAVIAVIVLVVLFPVLFILCWSLSLWSGRCCKLDGSRRRVYRGASAADEEKSEAGSSLEEGGEVVVNVY